MKILIIHILFFASVEANGQSTLTQRDWERQQEMQYFSANYKQVSYPRFRDSIFMDNGIFKFCEVSLQTSMVDSVLIAIVKSGLIYPGIMNGDTTMGCLIKQSTTEVQGPLSRLFGQMQSFISISNFHEVEVESADATMKRFGFYLFRKGMLNPQMYVFELTNKDVTMGMNIIEFVQSSTVTFFKSGTIVL